MNAGTKDDDGIGVVRSDEEIQSCFPVMRELRTQITESHFVKLVRKLEKGGYQLVFLREHGDVKAVAGFRITENLDNGRFIYVDDLVTKPDERFEGLWSTTVRLVTQLR